MLFGGLGSLYLKLIDKEHPLVIIGIIIILMLLPFLGLIYFRYRLLFFKKLDELEKV